MCDKSENERRRGYWWGRILDAAANYSNRRALFDDDSAMVHNQAHRMREHHDELAKGMAKLYPAAKAMLDHYVRLVESGDAGHWDPQDEDVVATLGDVLKELQALAE